MDYLRCPQCLAQVVMRPAEVACTSCGKVYPVEHEVPLLAGNPDFYYCPLPRGRLNGLLEGEFLQGTEDPRRFEALLQEIVDQIPDNARKPIWIENLVDESRAVAKYLTVMRPEHQVLNLGCGWDNTTINMARTARRVTAIDLTRSRVQLLALKRRYYGLGNIDLVCGGDTAHLPFADGSFDAVFINGVLEWVAADWSGMEHECRGLSRPLKFLYYLAAACTRHRPGRIQSRFLDEVRRVVKPTGEVFIGIENRFSRAYFSGRRDHHSFIRFGSLYPRLLAHVVSLLTRQRPYLTYTYGVGGYRSLLARARLPLVRSYVIEPIYRIPRRLVDLSSARAVRRFTRSRPTLRRLPAWLYRRTAPSFGLLGAAGRPSAPWIERVVDEFGRDLGHNVQPEAIAANNKGKLSLTMTRRDGSGGWLLKVPVSPLAGSSCERHFQALEQLRAAAARSPDLAPLLQLLPEPAARGTLDGQSWFAESLCAGQPWSDTVDEQDDPALWNDLQRCLRLLGRLPMAPHSAEQELALFDEKLGLLGEQAGVETAQRRGLEKLREVFGAAVNAGTSRSLLRKGDCTMSNVMVSKGRISGLIDFDEWGTSRDPLVDTADFLLSWWRHRRKLFWIDGLALLGATESLTRENGLPLQPLLTDIGATPGALARSALRAWLDHAYYGCRYHHLRLNRRWVGRVVLDVLTALDSRLGGDGRMQPTAKK
jgi:SAM-dependent methyltransferase/aminoglycoside phosphotransferase